MALLLQVNPLLKKYAREALDSGLPLVRPLWMLDPLDPACRLLADEFSVGEELIVAPVLQPGSTEREVYLPTGGVEGRHRWQSQERQSMDSHVQGTYLGYR